MTGTAPGRTLFVTGPGGDGATTVAAATALAAARAGRSTLLLSREPAAGLAPLLGAAPPAWPDEPAEVAPGLHVAATDPAARFRAGVLAAQRHARPALDALGAVTLDDDELTELPGSGAAALLTALSAAHATGRWRLVVVDLPPAADAVRLLALPAQVSRYLRRLLPRERRTARALRPLLAQLAGVPRPAEGLYEAADRWEAGLAAVRELIEGPGSAVRLVLDPGDRSAGALRAVRAGLALHGLAVESLVANRLLPEGAADPWRAAVAARGGGARPAPRPLPPAQRRRIRSDTPGAGLAALSAATGLAAPHPVPHLGREPRLPDLAELSVPPPGDVGAASRPEPELTDRLAGDGVLVWHLPLPGATRDGLGLVRRGDELIVDTGPFRRVLSLPPALRRRSVAGASYVGNGGLAVRFAPDPDRWPERAGPDKRPFG
ncbi:ArsA family ATPase [Streptomyces specialis]|uniref:ArsA family ATPase n=1 Tax=Streptomyces specialis TaxID=498367 RepID=UPI00073E742D|nr:ArsA-related P-loop ATPase [Streptomyces specialis]